MEEMEVIHLLFVSVINARDREVVHLLFISVINGEDSGRPFAVCWVYGLVGRDRGLFVSLLLLAFQGSVVGRRALFEYS